MNKGKVLSLLGLAMKAGKIASGGFSTEKAVKEGKGCLVVLAEDASGNTKKKFTDMCRFYEVPLVCAGTKEELGSAIGKELRSCLAVSDESFAKAVLSKLESGNQ